MRHLLVGLAALSLLVILVGGLSAFLLRQTVDRKDEVIAQYSEDLILLEGFVSTHERAARKARSFLLTGSERFLRDRPQTQEKLTRQLEVLESRARTAEERQLLASVEETEATLRQKLDGLLERRKQGLDTEEVGRQLELEVQPDRDELDATLATLKRTKERQLEEAQRAAAKTASRSFTLLAVAVGGSIMLSGALAFMLLRSWKRLLEAAAFQQRVIAIVGHDVRSPLAAILASTSHALRRPGLEGWTANVLTRVLRSARRIEVLTKLLMDFSQTRLTHGLNLAHEPADLHQLCEQIVHEVGALWVDRELVLEKQGDGLGDFDTQRMRQALANLVDNALRHGAPGTRVKVVSRGTNPSVLEVHIHNEGTPIDPKLLPHIFEPFRHGKPAQEVVRESLGMGLYIVSEVVKAHGGRVDVESSREQGTTFTLRLPRVPVSPEQALRA